LLVALPGGRFHARFLFLPASVAPGDVVWLRIERELNEATETRAPVDVDARVIDVLGPQCAPLQPGMRFLITIDHFDAPCASTEETRSRFVFLEDDEGPTEKQWRPWD